MRACLTMLVLAVALPGADANAEAFTFGWPVPLEMAVTAETQKEGNASTARYVLRLESAPDADELRLGFEDFELLTVNGRDAGAPDMADRLGPLASLSAALPTMRISRDGHYVGTIGITSMMERLLEALGDRLDEVTRDRLTRHFRSPEIQALMQQKSGEMWNIWVGAWNGADLEAGGTLQRALPVNVLGRTIEQKLLIEHLGAAPGRACCVRLRLTTLMEGPEVASLLAGAIRGLAPPGEPINASLFTDARSTNVVEVVTEAHTLLPRTASAVTEVLIVGVDGERHRRTEVKRFAFETP